MIVHILIYNLQYFLLTFMFVCHHYKSCKIFTQVLTKIKRKCFEKYQMPVSVLEVNSLNIIILALLFCLKRLLLHLWSKTDSLDVVMKMFLPKKNSIFFVFNYLFVYFLVIVWLYSCSSVALKESTKKKMFLFHSLIYTISKLTHTH